MTEVELARNESGKLQTFTVAGRQYRVAVGETVRADLVTTKGKLWKGFVMAGPVKTYLPPKKGIEPKQNENKKMICDFLDFGGHYDPAVDGLVLPDEVVIPSRTILKTCQLARLK